MKTSPKTQKRITLAVFILYLLLLLYLTVFRFHYTYTERQLNLTLFTDLIRILRNGSVARFWFLFLGNIGWFVPFGFLLPMLLTRKSLFLTVSLGFMFSLLVEVTQFVSYKGVAELDDLILNTLGAAIGYLLFALWRRWRTKPGRSA